MRAPFNRDHLSAILRQVRGLLLPAYGHVTTVHTKEAATHDVVTDLDYAVESFLASRLRELDPTITFVGEEHGGDRAAERFWLVDPIDGTAHFIRGLPFCTTMVALIVEGSVVLAAMYDFVHDDVYLAEQGKGATLNGHPIRVSYRPLKEAYLGWESHLEQAEHLRIFQALRQRCVLFKTVSSGYEHAMVAAGKLDGRVCFDPYGKDYDFAPGALLVAEAGGRVANLGTTTYDYRNVNFIAANPRVYADLTEGPEALFPIMK